MDLILIFIGVLYLFYRHRQERLEKEEARRFDRTRRGYGRAIN